MSPIRPLCVLVTGAGGLVGGALCAELLAQGHGVIGLVHRSATILANDRTPVPARPWAGGPPGFGVLSTLAGDIARPGLDLAPPAASELGSSIDVIAHCAGVTGFDLAQGVYEAVNVAGAANVADFALGATGRGPPALVHVSTAYVCGDQSGRIAETCGPAGTTFANGYEATKASAEREVWARRGGGLRVAIARPSIIVGESRTGAIRRFEHFYQLMKLIAEGLIQALPAAPDATLDLVPIDHVVGGLVDIIERMEEADGTVFHLVASEPTPLTALANLGPAYADFPQARFVVPELFDLPLSPTRRRLFMRAAGAYAAYLRRDPRFEANNLKRLSGRVCPPLGAPFLRRLVDYAISEGYLKRPRSTSHQGSSAPAAS